MSRPSSITWVLIWQLKEELSLKVSRRGRKWTRRNCCGYEEECKEQEERKAKRKKERERKKKRIMSVEYRGIPDWQPTTDVSFTIIQGPFGWRKLRYLAANSSNAIGSLWKVMKLVIPSRRLYLSLIIPSYWKAVLKCSKSLLVISIIIYSLESVADEKDTTEDLEVQLFFSRPIVRFLIPSVFPF